MLRRFFLLVVVYTLAVTTGQGQILATKNIDEGGSGAYPAFAVTESSLPDFVVYRPKDLAAAERKQGRLPILVWANGGCMNSSIHHERFLTELASHGYLIVAIGALQMSVEDRVHEHTPDDELLRGLDWIFQKAQTRGSEYYGKVDLDKVAAGGQSCGGAQTLRVAADKRIKTYMIVNAGMGDMAMAGASAESLQTLHGSVVYLIGGESDIAYQNAVQDYEKIDHVPVAFANHTTAGHGGTFAEQYGGSFGRMALDWLDWQFKGQDNTDIFLGNNLADYPAWTMKAKGFSRQGRVPAPADFNKPELEFVCELQVTIDQPMNLGAAPGGGRVIIPITGGTFAGPKLKGTVLAGGADYQSVSTSGERTELNAIYTIKTDDDVLIQVQNTGILYAPGEAGDGGTPEIYFRAAPKFVAPVDSDYAWLNNAIFICKPEGKEGYLSIQVWKVL